MARARRGAAGLGEGEGESGFASFLPSLDGSSAEAPVRRLHRGWGRRAETCPRRLRAADDDRGGADALRQLKPQLVELIASCGSGRWRPRSSGRLPPDREALAYEVTELFGHRPRQLADRPDRASFASGPRDDVGSRRTTATRSARSRHARVRPRPARPPAAEAPRAAADRGALLARDPRVAESPLGEPRRA